MKYTVRPGIVRVNICGAKLLVPDREASLACPQPMRLTMTGAVTWEYLAKGRPMEVIYKFYSIISKKTPEEIREKVDGYLATLCERGFLIAEDEP